jgi:hypothetical protein
MERRRPKERAAVSLDGQSAPRLLHDALYGMVEEVCWDADYLYRSFTEHFTGLMSQIYDRGGSDGGGVYTITGIKSGREARITWHLQHRLDFHGPNRLRLDYEIAGAAPGSGARGGSIMAELGTGRLVEDQLTVPRRPPGRSEGPRRSGPR